MPSGPALSKLGTRTGFEAHPQTASDARSGRLLREADYRGLERIRTSDLYAVDYGAGTGLTIDGARAHAIGVSDDWLARPEIQQVLGDLRTEQQNVVATLMHEVERRPLDFARHGVRIWPRDLDPEPLERLDRWASDEGFQHDLFGIDERIRAAHEARDRQAREAARLKEAASVQPATPIPDGFGGWRDTPAPRFVGDRPTVHIDAFDRQTGKPTDQLLTLLDLAARHPQRIVFAEDGKLMATPGAPALLAPLLHGWRNEQRITGLVVGTVRASREAGKPAWPPAIASAVRAHIARSAPPASRAPTDWSDGPSR